MSSAAKVSITLPPEMLRLIRRKVRSGAYASTSEVVREAMRDWQHREDERERRLAALDASITRGIADADAGRTRSIAAARAVLRRTPRRSAS
ncbi:MAG: type II toxin-antitoxin system ParD family antitoxin [Alphaproteobacteria bacterium]|nr:type II toxin-antitoxin system ParD family antitoxin [Alphaproteobacteria bacterium]MCW5740699.1 type II toxin-antitoxin system ParD family antitoxin [Alphaproteobacteria bacterium]